jgi:hypothetical protein
MKSRVLQNVTEEYVPRSEHMIIPADNIRRSRHRTKQNREYTEEELGDQQFPEQRGKIWIQNKLE